MSAGSVLQPATFPRQSWRQTSGIHLSWLSPNHRFLYAASEDPLSLGPVRDHESYISAYAIDPKTGELHSLNTVPSGGTSTCYLSVDKTGKYVLTASYGSGSISVLKVRGDGGLGEQAAFVQHIGHSGRKPRRIPAPSMFRPTTGLRSYPISDSTRRSSTVSMRARALFHRSIPVCRASGGKRPPPFRLRFYRKIRLPDE